MNIEVNFSWCDTLSLLLSIVNTAISNNKINNTHFLPACFGSLANVFLKKRVFSPTLYSLHNKFACNLKVPEPKKQRQKQMTNSPENGAVCLSLHLQDISFLVLTTTILNSATSIK